MIARRLLLSRLKEVAPAVSRHGMIPVLTHVCFTGDHVVACNDMIAISTPRASAFKGCIPAEVLTDLLAGSRAAVVELTAIGGNKVAVRLGRTSVMLPMLPVAEFDQYAEWFMPAKPPTQNLLKGIAGKFFAGVEHCLQTVTTSTTVPDQLGITVIPDESKVTLFGYDGPTISSATVPCEQWGHETRCVLSSPFCHEMLRLAKRAHTTRLAITGDHAVFAADDLLLFGRLIPIDRPLDFPGVVAKRLPKGYATKAIAAPRKLRPILERLERMVTAMGAERGIEISIADGQATLVMRSSHGDEMIETLQLPKHLNIEVRVGVSDLLKGYAAFAPHNILFTDGCVVMTKGDLLRLVGTKELKKAGTL